MGAFKMDLEISHLKSERSSCMEAFFHQWNHTSKSWSQTLPNQNSDDSCGAPAAAQRGSWSPLSEYFCPQCCRMPVPSSIFSHQHPNLHTNEHLNGLDDIIDLQLEIFLSRSLCLGRIKCAKWRTNRARTHTLMQEDQGGKNGCYFAY